MCTLGLKYFEHGFHFSILDFINLFQKSALAIEFLITTIIPRPATRSARLNRTITNYL